VVIGDFDSASAVMTGDFAVYPLPREKDDTDLLAAVKMGMERGFRRFRIFGGLGGRIDHTYGNFSVLQWIADNGGQGTLESRTTTVYLCRGGQEPLLLNGMEGRTVSVFPFGTDHCVVTYRGLQYPMNHGILSSGMPLGVSNMVLSPEASILVESGTALVFLTEEI
jgi:thiamine pyrophosphokinase